jgi:hypothetical protein
MRAISSITESLGMQCRRNGLRKLSLQSSRRCKIELVLTWDLPVVAPPNSAVLWQLP